MIHVFYLYLQSNFKPGQKDCLLLKFCSCTKQVDKIKVTLLGSSSTNSFNIKLQKR